MEEIFKSIKGFEGYYEISNLGNVRSTSYKGTKILKSAGKRYLQVLLCINQIKTHKLVHRLVAEAFIPNPNNYPVVNHKDGNKKNNTVDNLEWCTTDYNNQHAKKTNLLQRYEDRPAAKLTKEKVLNIPKYIEMGATTDDLAKLFNVSRRCIDNIFEGKNWTGLGIDFTKLKPNRKIPHHPSKFKLDNTVLNSETKESESV